MSLAARQALLARFLDDPAFERRARSDPEGIALEAGVTTDRIRFQSSFASMKKIDCRMLLEPECKELRIGNACICCTVSSRSICGSLRMRNLLNAL